MKLVYRKFGALFFAALLVFSAVCGALPVYGAASISADGASADAFADLKSLMPDEGAYRLSDGRGGFLDSDGLSLSEDKGETGKIFVLRLSGDFTCTLTEAKGEKLLAYDSAANLITLSDKAAYGTEFSILRLPAGGYMISPASAANPALCLSRDGGVGLTDFDGSETQIWYLEPVSITEITLAETEIELHPGSSYQIACKTEPAIPGAIDYTSSDPAVLTVDEEGKITALKKGEATVRVSSDSVYAECVVSVTPIEANAFFSQHNFKKSEGGWDGASLSKLRFGWKLFAVEHYNNLGDWMDEGCMLCCIAMLLSNLGAKLTTGYDIRTDKTDNLDADPYTVALANSGNYGAKKKNANLSGDPILMDGARVMSRFTVGGAALAYNKTSWGVTLTQIKEALDAHPEGVIVGFYQTDFLQHFMVFTECLNPDATDGKYRFTVCDPAAYEPELGNHVPFEECVSYTVSGYRTRHIISLSTITVLAESKSGESLVGNRILDSRIK